MESLIIEQSEIKKQSISGIDITQWFNFGMKEVVLNRNHLNAINVFPVADGDTGSNLVATLRGMVDIPIVLQNFSDMIMAISEAGLSCARGNSGIIFASYINGLAIEGQSYETINMKEFSYIAYKAVKYLYQAIENPLQGTIITVINDWATFLYHNHEKHQNFQELFLDAYKYSKTSLEKTRFQLEALKVNKVVDSGAAGFVDFLKGINRSFTGIEHELDFTEPSDFKIEVFNCETNKFQFCTEVFFEICSRFDDFLMQDIVLKIKSQLNSYGDSLVVSYQGRKMKVHIHTDTPNLVVEKLKEYGRIIEQKVDDIKLQNSVKTNRKNKIGILTDSIADIPEQFKTENQIHTLSLGLILDDVVYIDKVTIKLNQLFNFINKSAVYPSSSQAEPKKIRAFLENLLDVYESLIFITVSSKLSGTYNSILHELKNIQTNGKKVTIIDSKLNSGAQGLLVKAASDMANKGFSHDEIVGKIKQLIPKTKIYVCLNTIEYAIRSGRINSKIGKIGTMLRIRPIMTLDKDGKGATFGAGISKKGITNKIIKLIQKTINTKGINNYGIVHADNLGLAMEYKHKLTQMIGKEPEFIAHISSITAIHSGLGTVAVCLIED